MIDFRPISISDRPRYEPLLRAGGEHGCECGFVNLYLWGRQKAAVVEGQLVVFSQYNRKSVYMFPRGDGDKAGALEAIVRDASKRGIPCRLVGLLQEDCALLEKLYPEHLHYHFDRDSFDYVYEAQKLATLAGKKLQKKRNHLNRFRQAHPEYTLTPITGQNIPVVQQLVEKWYTLRQASDPHSDFQLERAALKKALEQWEQLELEGLLLTTEEGPVAMTVGSFLNEDTVDVHFEKALDTTDGAYPAITSGFAEYITRKYPQVQYLNREDDLGIPGLRSAKLSYYPDHMVEKYWACLLEDGYDY